MWRPCGPSMQRLDRRRDRKREIIWQTKGGGRGEEERAKLVGHSHQLLRGHWMEGSGNWETKGGMSHAHFCCYGNSILPCLPIRPLNSTTLTVNTSVNVQHIKAGMPLLTIFVWGTKLIVQCIKVNSPSSGESQCQHTPWLVLLAQKTGRLVWSQVDWYPKNLTCKTKISSNLKILIEGLGLSSQ